jgi:hypothetical protein
MASVSSLHKQFGPPLSRREWMTLAAAGVTAFSTSGWIERLAAATANNPMRRRSCILLWMSGGPSQIDTFDLKPGHRNGGPFREIATSAPGVRISEHLPQLARQMNDMVLIRSMSTREGDHGRATYYLHTGYLPQAAIQFPTMGSLISKELGTEEAALPNFVSIAPFRAFNAAAYSSGFLGPQYAPLLVGDRGNNQFFVQQQPGQDNIRDALRVEDLTPPGDIGRAQTDARIDLLEQMEREFADRHPGVSPRSHVTAYNRAVRLMRTSAARAFNVDEEPAAVRDRYGRTLFGQGCLLARRLVERGVPFIEVNLGNFQGQLNWDTHGNNFDTVRRLSGELDPAWATLMTDLRERGLLDSTLIVWMGEFGRTPNMQNGNGRDHFPNAWTTVLAGGGLRGGQVWGRTSADGMRVEMDRPTSVPDFFATVCLALGLDPVNTRNMSNVNRPIRIADNDAIPIRSIVRT